jgi:hypothetical protein
VPANQPRRKQKHGKTTFTSNRRTKLDERTET